MNPNAGIYLRALRKFNVLKWIYDDFVSAVHCLNSINHPPTSELIPGVDTLWLHCQDYLTNKSAITDKKKLALLLVQIFTGEKSGGIPTNLGRK